jgi:hypothetical protein
VAEKKLHSFANEKERSKTKGKRRNLKSSSTAKRLVQKHTHA